MNAISEIKSNIKQIDEIGLTVENLLGVRVELMAWYYSWLERLNRIHWLSVEIPSGQLSPATTHELMAW